MKKVLQKKTNKNQNGTFFKRNFGKGTSVTVTSVTDTIEFFSFQ